MTDLNDEYIKQYITNTDFSIMSLVSIAMKEQPDIITNFEKISKIDATALQSNVKRFMNNDPEFDDEFKVIITVFLSNLMYKNNIIPELVYDTLVQLNITDVTLEELKQNSQSLIDSLTSSVKKGGGWFSVVSDLFCIGIIVYAAIIDYSFVRHTIPVIEKGYGEIMSAYETTMMAKEFATQTVAKCGNIPIPDAIQTFDKFGLTSTNFTEIFIKLECIAQGHLSEILRGTPQFTETEIPAFTQRFSDATSKALIPYGINSDSRELVVLEGYVDGLTDILGSMIVRKEDSDESEIDFTKTLSNLQHYGNMPPEQFSRILKTQASSQQKRENKEKARSFKSMFSSLLSASQEDVLNFGSMLIDKVMEAGPVPAINVVDSYIFMIQDFCKEKAREIEDYQTESKRKLTDVLDKVYRVIKNITEFIRITRHLVWLNGIAGPLLLYYLRILFNKFIDLRRRRPQLEYRTADNFEGPEQRLALGGPEQRLALGGPEQRLALGGPEQRLMLEAPPRQGRAKGPRRAPGMNPEDIISSDTGIRTRRGTIDDAAAILTGMRNDIDGGRKHKTRKNKRVRTRRFKRRKRNKSKRRRFFSKKRR